MHKLARTALALLTALLLGAALAGAAAAAPYEFPWQIGCR
jgi:hypothetical protein